MAFCSNCGAEIKEGAKFCTACGTAVDVSSAEKTQKAATGGSEAEKKSAEQTINQTAEQAKQAFEKFIDTEDTTSEYSADDVKNGMVMGILAYIGILVLVPIFAAKENKFVRFHANQGLVVFIAGILYSVIETIITKLFVLINWFAGYFIGVILSLGWLIFVGYMVLGIVYVCTGKAKKLPLIGGIKILS